jgi:hypothetical protein
MRAACVRASAAAWRAASSTCTRVMKSWRARLWTSWESWRRREARKRALARERTRAPRRQACRLRLVPRVSARMCGRSQPGGLRAASAVSGGLSAGRAPHLRRGPVRDGGAAEHRRNDHLLLARRLLRRLLRLARPRPIAGSGRRCNRTALRVECRRGLLRVTARAARGRVLGGTWRGEPARAGCSRGPACHPAHPPSTHRPGPTAHLRRLVHSPLHQLPPQRSSAIVDVRLGPGSGEELGGPSTQ